MATTITAGNATNGAAISSDSTGILEFKTGTGSGTTALTLGTGQQAAYALGTAAAPSITFSGDTNTGIFSPAADTIAFAEGGVESMRIDSAGNVGIGVTTINGRLQSEAGTGVQNLRLSSASKASVNIVGAREGVGYWPLDIDALGIRFFSEGNERARIDTNGNLIIGSTSSVYNFSGRGVVEVNGSSEAIFGMSRAGSASGYMQSTSSDMKVVNVNNTPLQFWANNTERARISSSGAFGVSNTSPSYLVESGANGGNDALIRGQGAFLTRKYSVAENRSSTRTMRLTVSTNSLQFINIFLDASAHLFNNGGSWQAFRFASQFMCEGSILRLNQRMPNYEYGGSSAGVFTFGNPPSWTFVSGATWYFDFTVAINNTAYYTLTVQGPGIVDASLTTIV